MTTAQTLSLDDRRLVAEWAANCADQVLPIFEAVVPDDARVRAAIQQARDFASGALSVADAIRARGADAGGAARQAPTQAARAAAYAAEQAAAVAHLGAHALGAAGYTIKALRLASPDTDTHTDARRLVALATDDAALALASLPLLGGPQSGILGPGRLATGLVGDGIRAVQDALRTSNPGRRPINPKGDSRKG